MAKKKISKTARRMAGRKRVTLSLNAPHADAVYLMGDFNKWNEKAHPMKQETEGNWKKTIVLHPGRYEYRFLVDGRWQNDPNNDQICPNCFGTVNNVLVVSG